MFSTFSRAHAHDTHLDIILDEPHLQMVGEKLCIRHLLPKTINNFDADLIAMVVSHSYQGYSNVQKNMISHYVNHCSTIDCYSCNSNWKKLEQRNFVMNFHLSDPSYVYLFLCIVLVFDFISFMFFFYSLNLLLFFIFSFLFCISLSVIVIFLQSYFILKILT